MIIGKVVGSVWATRKERSLQGFKLMIVECEKEYAPASSRRLVAVDFIGAGNGERVLVSSGSAARRSGDTLSGELESAPVDAAIVGIIDP